MKILFVISDLWENSVERQLAEIIQELFDDEAETEILESLEVSNLNIKSLQTADAIWILIHGQNGGCPKLFLDFIENIAVFINDKPCALSSIGGDDGGEKILQEFYEYLKKLKINVMLDEVTCVPLRTERFECPKEYKWDLFWQKEAFIKFCLSDDNAADREIALTTIANNYVALAKFAIEKLKLKNVRKLKGQVVDGCLIVYALAPTPVELNFEQFATSDYPPQKELLLETESLEADLFAEDDAEGRRIEIIGEIIKQIESADI